MKKRLHLIGEKIRRFLFFYASAAIAAGWAAGVAWPEVAQAHAATLGLVMNGLVFLMVPVVLPFFMHFVGQAYAITVPLASLVQTIVLVLILPMALGALTRWWLIRQHGPGIIARIKPALGLIPASTMLLVMGLIFFSKGEMLAQEWRALLPLLGATLAFLVVILALMTWLNRRLGLSYAEHMAVAFVSSGKNNATAIAIAISVAGLSPLVAVPAATLPLFQAVLLVAYVHLAGGLRRWYGDAAPVAAMGQAGPAPLRR
ncbi:MAG: bile acid:sodium symporter [Rubrivivax sp.]|nr:bile acid:sodium symporter [Rubrivivax sp.]